MKNATSFRSVFREWRWVIILGAFCLGLVWFKYSYPNLNQAYIDCIEDREPDEVCNDFYSPEEP